MEVDMSSTPRIRQVASCFDQIAITADQAIEDEDAETMTRLLLVLPGSLDPITAKLQAEYEKLNMKRGRERSLDDYGRLL